MTAEVQEVRGRSQRPRIVIINKIPAPYRTPLYETIQKESAVEVTVVYCAPGQPNRRWKVPVGESCFKEVVLPGRQFFVKSMAWPIHINVGVWRLLSRENPVAVVAAGYESLAFWQALSWCRVHRRRFVLWSGATLDALHVRKGPVDRLRKFIIRSADMLLAYGSRAQRLLLAYGADPARIVVSCNTVDVDEIGSRVAALASFPVRVGSPVLNLLYVGQFIPRKGLELVLRALSSGGLEAVNFTVVGDGEERANLERLTAQLGLSERVRFAGYRQYEELPCFLAEADALIVPSLEEIWGLVINEGLAAGLPVLASRRAGATDDLIDGQNGVSFDPEDRDSTKQAILHIHKRRDEYRLKRMSLMADARCRCSLKRYALDLAKSALGSAPAARGDARPECP